MIIVNAVGSQCRSWLSVAAFQVLCQTTEIAQPSSLEGRAATLCRTRTEQHCPSAETHP